MTAMPTRKRAVPHAFALGAMLAAAASATGCNQTTITFSVTSIPGVVTDVDVDTQTVTLSRGAALVFDCTEVTELWRGPCRGFSLAVEDDDVAELIQAHPSPGLAPTATVAEDGEEGLRAAVAPTRAVLVGKEVGQTEATVGSTSSEASFLVEVIDPQPRP